MHKKVANQMGFSPEMAQVGADSPDQFAIYEDVMGSGYWVTLCYDIQNAWNYCVPQSEMNKEVESWPDTPDYGVCDLGTIGKEEEEAGEE